MYISKNYSIFCDRAGGGRETARHRVIFVSFPMRDDCNSAFGEVVFEKNDIDVVYVTTTDGNWFQYDDTELAARAIEEVVRDYDDVVAYGTSMGGFGALSFSGLIGATVVISCSPQYSIDPRKTPFEGRYTSDSSRIQGSHGFLHDDLGKTLSKTARLVLLFDPLDENDSRHAKLVEGHRSAERLPVPFSGHKSLATLREMGLASELVRAAATGRLDLATFRREMRSRRWQSPTYLRFLARALNRKKLPGVVKAIGAAAQLPGRQTWDALRNDVRFASEHGAQELAIGQFSKLVRIGSYVAKYMFVTDFYRWSSALLSPESRPATKTVLFDLIRQNGEPLPLNLHLIMAKMHACCGEWDEAREHLRAIEGRRHELPHIFEVVEVLEAIGDASDTVAVLIQALDDHPTDLKVLNLLSDRLFRQDRHIEALKVLEHASTFLALPPHPHRHRFARLLEMTGRIDDAIDELSAIIAVRPDDALAHRVRGDCLARLNRHEEACEDFRRALSDSAQILHAARGLALSLLALNRHEEADGVVRRGLEMDPHYGPLKKIAAAICLREVT